MRKQTKLVAVLSAAALLAMGASMTSFAAGWEKDDAGIWHYYDSDDELVTGEWRKDGGQWFYLDDDGDMLTDSWVDDEYYVDENGAMLVNTWKYTYSEDGMEDPEDDGEAWYFFGNKGTKIENDSKKINGKTYYFNEDGRMRYGWYADDNGNVYYLGDENDGARTNNAWLWLEAPDEESDLEDEENVADTLAHELSDADPCDSEGWYWFASDGKMYRGDSQKKINGKYYFFNRHGQMLYEWINGVGVQRGSNASLDWNNNASAQATDSDIVDAIRYVNAVEEGWRADGWYEIDGANRLGVGDDTSWYYFEDGKAKKASMDVSNGLTDDGKQVYRAKIKIKESGNSYFCFDQYGQMKTGLQLIDGKLYYFDSDGYLKTGKVNDVEEENDSFTYYFETKNGKNGQGITGEKSGYLYWNGKRLEADDDYRLYTFNNAVYLVNDSGKLQKSTSKDYVLENDNGNEYRFEINSNTYKVTAAYAVDDNGDYDETDNVLNTLTATVPEIYLMDGVIGLKGDRTDSFVYATVDDYQEEFGEDATVSLGGSDSDTDDSDTQATASQASAN